MAMADDQSVYPGADEATPSRAQYFTWINNTNEGSTEQQTLINLEFFQWLRDEYGMALDIYAFDAGNIDGPGYYGSLDSDKLRGQFPRGFDPTYRKALAMGCRLGMWGGPDGFGDTSEQEQKRIDTMARLCRDWHFMLFKFDSVCGQLRPEKQDAFVRMMKACRQGSPDLILLNHRLELGKGLPYATTFLFEGAETYIDVHMANRQTAPHNRAEALSRKLVPELRRLTEDHGVCLSSCLDYWDDDLVLQAFNRCLILAPEIYGNPWFLRDEEFPKLARIYNLHRRCRQILVTGMVLPEQQYGPYAVSRGDGQTRWLTLRNLTWEPVTYAVKLDETIGLTRTQDPIELRQFHPTEKTLGTFAYGDEVPVQVLPFRACLLMATAKPSAEVGVHGCDYEVVRDTPGKPVAIKLLGFPGQTATVSLAAGGRRFRQASLDGEDAAVLLRGEPLAVSFPGRALRERYHRKLGALSPIPVPADAEALYEATCFAADSNALEVRCIERSGPTRIPQVQRARDAFFAQPLFTERAIWDRNLFDGRMETTFAIHAPLPHHGGALRVDLGEPSVVDKLVLRGKGIRVLAACDVVPPSHLLAANRPGGLTAEYFAGTNFEMPILRRTDPQVDFHWGWQQPPAEGMPQYNFSIRWSGQLRSGPTVGEYTFVVSTDQGVRLWIDNRLVIDEWTAHGRRRTEGKICLDANQTYDLKLEYSHGWGEAIISLAWVGPGPIPAEVSADLMTWRPVALAQQPDAITATVTDGRPLRYFRVAGNFSPLAEVEGYRGGAMLHRSRWRASNLFEHYAKAPATAAWSASFTLDEAAKGSYLAIALPGRHGVEGAFAALRVDGKPVGCPSRAPSFQSNVWEYFVRRVGSHYTYYAPVSPDMLGKKIEVVVLVLQDGVNQIQPEAWITVYPTPFEAKELVLTE